MAKKNKHTSAPASGKAQAAPATAGNTFNWAPWALAALAFALYATGFGNQMVAMDDHSATVDNPAVTGFSFFGGRNLGMYAPVTWLGYAIAFALGANAKEPMLFHLLSALVHALNVVLVYQLFQQFSRAGVAAALAAFFFAIHPMQVEAVAWIAGFSTPLFTTFSLLALVFYLRHIETGVPGSNYFLSILFFLLACLAKSAAVSLPLTMLVLDAWFGRAQTVKTWLEKAPFFALSLVFGLMTFYTRSEAGHTVSTLGGGFTVVDRFWMVCHTVLFYWTKLIAPFGLSIWYPFEKTTSGAWPWTYYAAPPVLAALLFGAWKMRDKMPFVWYGLLFYLSGIVLALPYYTIATFELRSDRYNYFACLGIFALLAALPAWLRHNKPSMEGTVRSVLIGLGVLWLVLAALRIRDWHDTITLIDKAIANTGDNFGKAYLWRGMENGDQGKIGPSIQDLSKAIEKNPTLTDAYKYRGGLYGMTKQFEKSVNDLDRYLSEKPNDHEMLFNRGLSLSKLGRNQEALRDFNKTLEINPNFNRAYRARANVYQALGDTAKAAEDMKRVGSDE